jgi:putative transposase
LKRLAREADMEWLMIDSTIVRAHQQAAGAPKKKGGRMPRENDITHAHELIDGFTAKATIADKGYDANHLHEEIAQRSSEIVIPPKRNRKVQRAYDVDLYKERNLIERFFNKLKQFRRVATRYDKLLANFMGFVKLAAIQIWLK